MKQVQLLRITFHRFMSESLKREILLYLFATMVSGLIFFLIYMPGFHFAIPITYQQDALWVSATVKTLIETGGYLTNSHLGAPGSYSLIDFPISDGGSILLIKGLALFSHHYAVVLNAFYLLTFLLCTVFSLPVLRLCGIDRAFAVAGSLLFTYLPYHLLRGESHLFLTSYYVVPLYMLIVLYIFPLKSEFYLPISSAQAVKQKTFHKTFFMMLVCVFAASSGVYYAFFAAYFILLSGIISHFCTPAHLKKFVLSIFFVVIIIMTVFVNTLPNTWGKNKLGPNHAVSSRRVTDAEFYGLKVIQLLLPVDGHRLRGLDKSKQHYNKMSVFVNENTMVSLGIVGSIGFIISLACLLCDLSTVNGMLFLLSRLNVFGILLGTVGGLGAVFAFYFSPLIRGYNRISVFIAFFSLCAFFIVVQKVIKPRWQSQWIAAIIILCIGLLDEVPIAHTLYDYALTNNQISHDRKFIEFIERKLLPNSQIFQLPVMHFPETAPIYNMKEYVPFKAYLYSQHLIWSYGAIKGRTVSAWQDSVAHASVAKMLEQLAYAGFAGIFLDRDGYPQNNKKLEKELLQMLRIKPDVSADGHWVFYDMSAYIAQQRLLVPRLQWYKKTAELHQLFTYHYTVAQVSAALEQRWDAGFSDENCSGQQCWRWVGRQALLRINNHATFPIMVQIDFILQAYQLPLYLHLSGDLLQKHLHVQALPFSISEKTILLPGTHVVRFTNSNHQQPCFKVINFKITPVY